MDVREWSPRDLGSTATVPSLRLSVFVGLIPPPDLTLITGPMFAGKTTELFRRVEGEAQAGERVLIIRHPNDVSRERSNSPFSPHDPESTALASWVSTLLGCDEKDTWSWGNNVHVLNLVGVEQLWEKTTNHAFHPTILCLDEIQFYPRPQVLSLLDWARKERIRVLVAGLDRRAIPTKEGEYGWETMEAIFSLADEVTKLRATCSQCEAPNAATWSSLKKNQTLDACGVLVGGADIYDALCSSCWKERNLIKIHIRAGKTGSQG